MPELAIKFDVNPSTVQKHVRKSGLTCRPPRLGPNHKEEAAQLYQEGDSPAKIGRRFGAGKDTVARALQQAGVTLRRRAGRA